MKKSIIILVSCFSINTFANADYDGSTFSEVWGQVTSDEYKKPQNKISFFSIGGWFASKIKKAAKRTISDRSDILPQFRKLAHPNGICLAGTWNITEENPYSGYFKSGTTGLIIARASTALSNTKVGKHRAFGLAGKIFPTTNPDHQENLKTGNFFLVDDLGGTKAKHITDVGLLNAPPVSKTSAVFKHLGYVLKLAKAFKKADSNPNMRQVYEVSELGEENLSSVVTPKWMKVIAAPGQTVDAADFRDELDINKLDSDIQFEIYVASTQDSKGNKNWSQIGMINFTESVISNSCDHRLHFHHPKWKSNLVH